MATNARQKLLHTFSIDHNSEVDDRRYMGKFTTKKLTIRDLATLGVRKTQLNGGFHHDPTHPGCGIDDQTDEFNNMLAHLEMSLVTKPEWWNLDEITDLELLGKVYKEVLLFENSFLGRSGSGTPGGGELGGSGSGSGEAPEGEADASGSPREVVDSEVQSALEP